MSAPRGRPPADGLGRQAIPDPPPTGPIPDSGRLDPVPPGPVPDAGRPATPPPAAPSEPPPAGPAPGAGPADPHPPDRRHGAEDLSVGDLVNRVSRDLSSLMRQELALAQAELKQEARSAGRAAGGFGAAGYAASMVLLFLSVALWAGLANVMDGGWAGVIVAAVWAVIGAIAFVIGRDNLRRTHPKPERAVDTIKQVPDALKGR